jgi:hypothetical protein
VDIETAGGFCFGWAINFFVRAIGVDLSLFVGGGVAWNWERKHIRDIEV